jgi:hypothetical protein
MDGDGAVRGQGSVAVGVHPVGEGRRGGVGEVGDVDGELVWGGCVGYEDTVGADRLKDGEFVQADDFVIYYDKSVRVQDGMDWVRGKA